MLATEVPLAIFKNAHLAEILLMAMAMNLAEIALDVVFATIMTALAVAFLDSLALVANTKPLSSKLIFLAAKNKMC
jgi:hypothetical protein